MTEFDFEVEMWQGEKRPIYAQVTALSGTLTISGTPTFTLYDSEGSVVTGWNGVGVTGDDAGADTDPRVWYLFDTTAAGAHGSALAAGVYTALFESVEDGSDGMQRIYRSKGLITLKPVP